MRRTSLRVRRPSAPLVISMLALFVALSGASLAATSVVKEALHAKKADVAKVANVAKNSLKLEGQTAAQIAATPGPADSLNGQTAAQIIAAASAGGSVAGKLSIHSAGWAVDSPSVQNADWYANCDAGQKVVGGGWDETNGNVVATYSRPKLDGSGWWFKARAIFDSSLPANGSVWAVCVS